MIHFEDRNEAWGRMQQTNHAHARIGNQQAPSTGDMLVLVDGPDDDHVVMTLTEAIEGDFLYEWAC